MFDPLFATAFSVTVAILIMLVILIAVGVFTVVVIEDDNELFSLAIVAAGVVEGASSETKLTVLPLSGVVDGAAGDEVELVVAAEVGVGVVDAGVGDSKVVLLIVVLIGVVIAATVVETVVVVVGASVCLLMLFCFRSFLKSESLT